MLPATRVVPKPLITVVDRPVVQYVVEEAAAAGVTEVVLVVDDRPGDPVASHFTQNPPIVGLEDVTFSIARQAEPRGLGDAVLSAREAVGDRPFLCLLSDMIARPARAFCHRLLALFDGQHPVVALKRVTPSLFTRYGIVSIGESITGDVVEVEAAVEKPGEDAPSDLGIVGRYVFTPDVFDRLAALEPGHGGEIQLTDAIDGMARASGALGLIVGDDLLDVGNPAGLVAASVEIGLAHPELGPGFRTEFERLL